MSLTKFGREMNGRGHPKERDGGVIYRLGLQWSGNIDWEWGYGLDGA